MLIRKKDAVAVVDVTLSQWDVDAVKRKIIDMYRCLYDAFSLGRKKEYDEILDLICFVDLVENESHPINDLDGRKLYEFLTSK